ncbi:MAG TPA: MarR family transcriptional regulator [Atopostipes sp.]|nr:MarR family transcriptional regulator [Atopostipes sp.]
MAQMVDINELLDKLNTFDNQFSRIKKQILDKQNLNSSTVNLISIIGNETMTLKQITEISELDKSTISRQINVLVKNGLVIREVGEDKRFSFFELSKEAKDMYQQYIEDFVDYFDDTLRGWTEEEKHMFSVLVGRANYSMSNALSKDN